MKKQEFLRDLKKKIATLSRRETQEHLSFYSEMIDDRIEEGLSEDEAVMAVGDVQQIAHQIIFAASEESNNKSYSRKLKAWETVLLIIGSPIWISILVALFAIVWSLIIAIWAVEAPFIIFSFISKYLFIACKAASKWGFNITKQAIKGIKSIL